MRLPKWKGIPPRQNVRPVKRSGADLSEGLAWLDMFRSAINAGKTANEAIEIADVGAAAYGKRFPAEVAKPLTGGPK